MSETNHEEFLLVCEDCGTPFFTAEEKAFYESLGYVMPKRCKPCRDRVKKVPFWEDPGSAMPYTEEMERIYNTICDDWSIEAKKEDVAYFYNVEEVNALLDGKKSFLIGRKGSGKTSIAQYLCQVPDCNLFAEKLSFKNFPFNRLYSLENTSEYTTPNQYISIWKYLIYSYVCREMIQNESVDADIRDKLSKLYGGVSSGNLKNMIGEWTNKAFGIELFGSGLSYERERNTDNLDWIDKIEILESIILDYCGDAKYFVVFDELDEDYRDFPTKEEETRYMCMLTSLFKAVQDIRSIFDDSGKQVYPVVFLRSDIYERITDSDKNKWRESLINMEWDTARLQNMLKHRLNVLFGEEHEEFVEAWHKLFEPRKVKMGNRASREMDIYDYIERSTEMRPRDFIRYVKECAFLAKQEKQGRITPKLVKDADDNFSEYLKNETVDELFARLPEVNEILGLLSTIRKQSFSFAIFEKEYNELLERSDLPKRDVKEVLLLLFDAGVIGNQPSMATQALFKFAKNTPRFNFKETMIIHRGLYRALQIF